MAAASATIGDLAAKLREIGYVDVEVSPRYHDRLAAD
jgi:hypothetical protein